MVHLKDKKIEVLENRPVVDQYAHHSTEQVVVATCWAYVRHLYGDEIVRAALTESREELLFQIPWRPGLTSTRNAIRYRTELYNITRIDYLEGYKRDVKIYAKKARS